jgi:hypothetical protein
MQRRYDCQNTLPMSLDAIRTELSRLAATAADVGEADSIAASDEGAGWASLGASEARRDLYWYGRAEELLERLRRLPDAAGPDAVREAFRSLFPG